MYQPTKGCFSLIELHWCLLPGTIPASVVFGVMVDQTCLIWHSPCGASGNSIVYENGSLAYGILVAIPVVLSISMSLYHTSMLVYSRASARRGARRQEK